MVKLATFLIIPRRDPGENKKTKKHTHTTDRNKGGYMYSPSLPDQLELIFPSGFANHASGFLFMKCTENAPKCT